MNNIIYNSLPTFSNDKETIYHLKMLSNSSKTTAKQISTMFKDYNNKHILLTIKDPSLIDFFIYNVKKNDNLVVKTKGKHIIDIIAKIKNSGVYLKNEVNIWKKIYD